MPGAVILTALVCWLFLGSLSSTMNVLFAIPMSLLGTIAVLYFLGYTLNTFTLLGLSLAVGLVVDDAVMVMENIFRHAEMGKDRMTAAGGGDEGDHLRGARGDARGHRDLPAGRLHDRHRRQVLPPVRRDALGRGRALVPRGDHARAGAVRADARTSSTRCERGRRARSTGSSTRLEAFYARDARAHAPATVGRADGRGGGARARRGDGDVAPGGVRAVAGPEPAAVRLTTAVGSDLLQTDHLVQRCEAFLKTRPEVAGVMSSIGGSVEQLGEPLGHARRTGEADADAERACSAVIRKEF